MSTVTLEDAQAHLRDLIDKLTPGEEITITRDDKPVARLVAHPPPAAGPRPSGTAWTVA